MFVTVKLRDRNSFGGTRGFARCSIMNGSATTAATPTARLATTTGSPQPVCWPRIVPNASPPTASTTTSEPSQSKWPLAFSSRDSGT